MRGLVLKSMGSWYTVLLENGEQKNCRIRGKFRIKGLKLTNPVAVGDWVDVKLEDGDDPVIIEIEERKNYIIRKSVNLSKQYHILASNLDQAILLVTIGFPFTSFEFIDRFLITAEAYEIPVIIVVNKIDLYDEQQKERLVDLMMIYGELDYKVELISVKKKQHINKLKDLLVDKTTVVVGHSGVGKSSLLNELCPEFGLKTSIISEAHQQGTHTTTFAEMIDLPGGGKIIDTPGIKGLGVVDIEKQEVANYFREFLALKKDCHFHNCIHINEPKCAVKKAVEEGDISQWRYRSYLSIYQGDEQTLYR